jgi:Asp-tRNA(Asn)/Glu-tRNA(Gln) amidotransferase A subunit family amidase
MTDDLAMLTATDLVAHYRRKTLSPVEVAEAVLARIDRCAGLDAVG